MKKILFYLALALAVLVIGGIGGVIMDRYVFPYLAHTQPFARYDFVKRATEEVMIVNTTEQITVREDDSIITVSSQAATAVTQIVSVPQAPTRIVRGVVPPQSRSGTGVIITSDGIIVTYADAILPEDATYRIFIFDGRAFDATLVGIDQYTNLAFLRIDAENLPSIALINSDDARTGKKLIAIGNTISAYENRFASGVLSHINRSRSIDGGIVSSSEKLDSVFEVDFNSLAPYLGGPVVDFNGEMVGLIGASSVVEDVYKHFLVRANDVRDSLERIVGEQENSIRAKLGVSYISLTPPEAALRGFTQEQGAFVSSLLSTSNAQIHVGDVITAVDEELLTYDKSLSALIAGYKPGDEISLKILRAGKELTLAVVLQ